MAHAHGFATRLSDTYPQGQFVPSGKFGRMFPRLEPFLPPDDALVELGEVMKEKEPLPPNSSSTQIPLGYTYLGQFIAHDITFDPTSLKETLLDPLALQNFRTPGLDLDSLYGAGPAVQPYIYERTSDRFLIGKTSKPGLAPTVQTGLLFDLPRGPEGIALIVDPRNDENLILAQMHLAFLRFHNKIVQGLQDGSIPRMWPQRTLFEEAKKLVVWHYQWIILHDFLGLLLDTAQLSDVLKNGRKFYRPQGEPFIPVEFSAAAYRFGHSMISGEYDYNHVFTFRNGGSRRAFLKDLFTFTGVSGHGKNVPIPSDWIIDWRRFFELDERVEVAFSRPIGPFLTESLHELPEPKSLSVRNLRRGCKLGLPSGQSVAKVLDLPALTRDEISREPDGQVAKKHQFDVETPLWYYVLKEAQVRGQGQRLGPVGSRIVAEVFVGLLELDSESFLARKPQWKPTLPVEQRPLCTVKTVKRSPLYNMRDLLKFTGNLSPIDDPRNLNRSIYRSL